MKNNKKDNSKFDVSKMTDNHNGTFTDDNGDTWTKDGLVILDECPPGSIMDRINRRCNGEELPPLEDEKEKSGKKK